MLSLERESTTLRWQSGVGVSYRIKFDDLVSAERLGSGDGERKTLLTRQIAFEPLPASVLFALCWSVVMVE